MPGLVVGQGKAQHTQNVGMSLSFVCITRRRGNDSEEKAVKPIQRRKLIKKEEPVAPQVEEAQAEAPVEEAPATEEQNCSDRKEEVLC